jgi:hypothetical protein
VHLSVDCTAAAHVAKADAALVSPIEHCLRTKWTDAAVVWKNGDPIL